MNIGIDIDDTISNTYETVMPIVREYVKNVLKIEREPDYTKCVDHNYITTAFGIREEDYIQFWNDNYFKVLENVKPKTDAIRMINKLKSEGNKIIIITARWDINDGSAYELSKKWLLDQGIQFDKLYTGIDNKVEVAKKENIDILIDDSIKNCEEASMEGIKSFLMSTPVNEHYNGEKTIRVNSWNDLYKKIKEEF